MDHSLNLEETQTDSFLEDKRESKLDWDYSDHSLRKIGDFFIKIDTILNLLEIEIENDSSEKFDKILRKENPSEKIIEAVHSLDLDTEVNLNPIYLSDEPSLDFNQLKVSIENKIIEKITEENIWI